MSATPNMSSPIESAARARSAHPLRAISFGNPAVTIDRRDDGAIYLRPKIALGDYPLRITDRLHHWAATEPNRVFMAARDGGGWRKITYAQLLKSARRIATVTSSAPLAANASRIASEDENLPVPKINRERNSRFAMTNGRQTCIPASIGREQMGVEGGVSVGALAGARARPKPCFQERCPSRDLGGRASARGRTTSDAPAPGARCAARRTQLVAGR